jgi:hypothetical protein
LALASVAKKLLVSMGRNALARRHSSTAASSAPAGLGELVAVLQQQPQVLPAQRAGGGVVLAGEEAVERGPRALEVALGVPDPAGEQQRAGRGPGGGGGPLGQLPRPRGHLGGGLAVAGVEGGPAELLQGERLRALVAGLGGEPQRAFLVGERPLVLAERRPHPPALEAGAHLQAGVEDAHRGGDRPAEQPLGVPVGVEAAGPGGGSHPCLGRDGQVAGGGRVPGGRLRPVGQQGGQPPVAGDPGRPREAVVEDLADQVVGELVGGARLGLHQQARGQRPLGPGRRLLDRHAEQVGDHLQVERRAHHHRRAQQRLHLGAGPADAGQHRVAERGGDAGRALPVALGGRAQRLHHEQGVAAGPLQHRGGQLGDAVAPGQFGDRGRRQRPELQHPAGAGQSGQRLGALLGADGGDHQQPVAGQPAHQEVQQLQG